MTKGKKYAIPVLIDPKLQKSEYYNPMDIVLLVDENGNPKIRVKDIINKNNELINQVNNLSKAIVNINDSLNSFKKDHNNLVRSYKKQIKALKAQLIELQEVRK